MSRTYGTAKLVDGVWKLDVEPHVSMWLKRVFPKVARGKTGTIFIANSDSVARDLQWFLQRYPLLVEGQQELDEAAKRHQEVHERMVALESGEYVPPSLELAIPLREYQSVAAHKYLLRGFQLIGDDVGLGKTASAIASFCDHRTLPGLVVTMAHLPRQWKKEIGRFAPSLYVHELKKGTPYELPKRDGKLPDVIVSSYHKLRGWAGHLKTYCKSVVFDECQELRRSGTDKYDAAAGIAQSCSFACGLSATPIYNYGGEIYNVLDAIRHGCLGTRDEFMTEWCEGYAGKERLKKPREFGSWLRDQHILTRRTRQDVGRELPPVTKVVHEIDSDSQVYHDVHSQAEELAKILLDANPMGRGEKMRAAEEFNTLMRQATGLAKAPHVAAFVKLLIESGERVVLFGWHRAVYDLWGEHLKEFEPSWYTGEESGSCKQKEATRFIDKKTPLLIMSLRSGAGLDGLQHACRTVVFGEFDWSPAVHDQNIGRVFRDGQSDPVMAYFLMSDSGVDPIMAEVLGLKREQSAGLLQLDTGLEAMHRHEDGMRKLAERFLKTGRKAVTA